ncbi:MAG: nitrous oxide-stimulated promoter family protein [Anaerolineae bacterium]
MGRIEREKKTIAAMIRIYCRDQHGGHKALCASCQALLQYALQRLDKCPFGAEKPTCARCPVHCYKPSMREEIRRVMRYAGPRMLYTHPILAIRHLWDERRKPPALPQRKRSAPE